jgi:uncharacterized protein
MKARFVKESFFSVTRQELFAFHEEAKAFALLTPPSSRVKVLTSASTIRPSEEVVKFVVSFLFFKFRFEMVHTEYQESERFVDEQKRGLFSKWRHVHRFLSGGWRGDPASLLIDLIEFRHPLLFMFKPFVMRRLKKIFAFRHKITAREVNRVKLSGKSVGDQTVVLTGATGLIGTRIAEILVESGVKVVALVRNPDKAARVLGDQVSCRYWDFDRPEKGDWKDALDGALGVIHLAGTPLFLKRWTKKFKAQMESSRVESTRQLVEAIRATQQKPQVFVSASAVGIYGTDPSQLVDEDSPAGDDLLADICVKWEEQARKLSEIDVRNVQCRTGIVLSKRSGALKEMLPLFRLGLGGSLGYSDHWINWIHLEDVARIFIMALFNREMSGAYNLAAPNPVNMGDFSKILAKVLKRPCFMKYPVGLLKLGLGEKAEYASGGSRVKADKVIQADYSFFYEQLQPALANILGR